MQHVLNQEQLAALASIVVALDRRTFGACLLHGVTGSGKTAVYLAAMQRARQEGRSAILLVPEIGLTPAMAAQLYTAFGDSVALLHSALATERTGAFRSWTLLLAILGFSLSLIGTFLVRSGVLSSVHAFASDPTRGVYILAMLAAAIGGALALFAWRAPQLQSGAAFEPVSKESALLLNNVLLSAAAATVFIGTLYPLLLDALTGQKISVGPPYFAITFAPIFVVLILLVPFGPRLGWRNGDWRVALRVLMPAAGAASAMSVLAAT